MKKTLSKLICLSVMVFFILTMLWVGSNNSSSIMKMLKKESSPQNTLTKQKDPCIESDEIIQAFRKKIPDQLSGDDKSIQKTKMSFLHDASIAKMNIENNECGASSAYYLGNAYFSIDLKEKANEYHKMAVDFAETGNQYAIINLCFLPDSVTDKEQKLHYCKTRLSKNPQKRMISFPMKWTRGLGETSPHFSVIYPQIWE